MLSIQRTGGLTGICDGLFAYQKGAAAKYKMDGKHERECRRC